MEWREIEVFRGQVVAGEMRGHRVRVTANSPVAAASSVYTITFENAQVPGRRVRGSVAGRAQLDRYFRDLRMQVDWAGGRSPLDSTAATNRPKRSKPGRWSRADRKTARRKIVRHKRTQSTQSTRSKPGAGLPQADDTPLWTATRLPDGLSSDEMMDIIASTDYALMHADDVDPG